MRQRHDSGDALADRRADYAKGLADDGDPVAAADLMRQALELAPRWAAGWTTLGLYLEKAARRNEAADAFETALRLDPADGFGAGLKLAALGRRPVPETAPPAFVRGLFDQYAGRFETALVGRLAYQAPDRLMEAIRAARPGAQFKRALDLGCGTGLMGERLRAVCDTLDGVDLSPAMLDQARRKNLYDDLREADILQLAPSGPTYDLVAAADVLNYVGRLEPVFAIVERLLSPGGLFAFTLEAHGGPEAYRLGEALRYTHSAAAVESLLTASGYDVRHRTDAVLRQDRDEPVGGLVFVVALGR